MEDKSFSYVQSKIHLEDLMSNTPVLNGYLKTYEDSDHTTSLKSNLCITNRKTDHLKSKYQDNISLQKMVKAQD